MSTRERRSFRIRGRVQGVGFRPFVFRLATGLGLTGIVGNDAGGAFVEVEGSAERLTVFAGRLATEAPPLARIDSLEVTTLACQKDDAFAIVGSDGTGAVTVTVPPDVAPCATCLSEMANPADRRHRYPFINCTDCGPRYSIVTALPYDRPQTTMASFAMCPACAAEYEDPSTRRFHAQPDACPVCGPRVWLTDGMGATLAGDPIDRARQLLEDGGILAVKGLGGFHLACRADDEAAVRTLRRRKSRETKPLAVMVATTEQAETLAVLDDAARAFLRSAQRPIVLCLRREDAILADAVAPGVGSIGLMLPSTPLHELLVQGLSPLVMTSGNPSEEPLSVTNEDALRRLAGIADGFLLHDRDIARPIDDSVVMADPVDGSIIPLRRARGYVPDPIFVPTPAREPILALGGDLKAALCILDNNRAVMSEHLGDLEHPAAFRHWADAIDRFLQLTDCRPAIVVSDLHPGYHSARYDPLPDGGRRITVQHHHAHVVSCMADNGLTGRVVGLACDGTGYGTDGSIWGCEVLLADAVGFSRVDHLRSFALAGGDAAARDTWRPAVGLLHALDGKGWRDGLRHARGILPDPRTLDLTEQILVSGVRAPRTSSLGRLFDAVSFLLGTTERNHHEGQAAMALEHLAGSGRMNGDQPGPSATHPLDPTALVDWILAGLATDRAIEDLAYGFHTGIGDMLVAASARAAGQAGLDRVCCSGGCFLNALLRHRVRQGCTAAGLTVFFHRQVPTGDGGLALGQAVIAAASA